MAGVTLINGKHAKTSHFVSTTRFCFAGLLAFAVLMAGLSVSAKTICPLGGSHTDWSSPSSYDGAQTPEKGDDCRLNRGSDMTYSVSDDNPASMATFLNMQHMRVFGTNVTIVVDVKSSSVTAALERVYQDGTDASRRGIKYGGRLVKIGPGELVFANTAYVGTGKVLLNCDIEVREGRVSMPRAGKIVQCDGYVTICNGASFVAANKDTYVGGLRGDGEFLNPTTFSGTASEIKCFVTGKGSVFGGKVGAQVRFDTSSSGGEQFFTGTANLSTYNQVEGGGVLGGVDFGDVPNPSQSSLGTDELRFFRYGTFRNLATEPKTTGRNFALQDMTDGVGFLDSGDYGGWTVTSKVFFARAIGDGSQEYWRMQRLGFKGDNDNESVFSGVIPMRTLGGTNYTMHITKDGTGTWKILENPNSALHGAISVKNGTLRYDTLAEKGVQCALGSATILYEDYFGLRDPSKAVDWAWKLGGEGTCGTLEYAGEGGAWTTNRAAVLTGAGGGFSNASTSELGLFGGVSPLGAEEVTMTLGGTTTAYNVIGNLTDGEGKLSLTKVGSNSWVLDAGNTFSGDLDVREGTLYVRDTTKYSWFKWIFRERESGKNDNETVYGCEELGLYDADNVRVNANLRPYSNYFQKSENRLPPGYCGFFNPGVLLEGSRPTHPIEAMFDDGASKSADCESFAYLRRAAKDGDTSAVVVDPNNPDTWTTVNMHLPFGAKPAKTFDFAQINRGWNYQREVKSFRLLGSVDGRTWDRLLDKTLKITTGSSVTVEKWVSSGATYTIGSAGTHAGGFSIASGPANPVSALANVGYVSVGAGARLVAENGSVCLDKIKIDETGAGAICNCSFASSGTINIVNHQKGFAGDLGLAFESCEGLSNLSRWTLLVDGRAKAGWSVSVSGDKLRLHKPGLFMVVQ